MLRSHTCGELRIGHVDEAVTLCGWIQRSRDLGGMTFIDLRDRYGITQLVFNMETDRDLCEKARELGREYVVKANGIVRERSNKNPEMDTGDIEIEVSEFQTLNPSKLPPFTIEEETDGGEELRMKHRVLDLRREPMKQNLYLRHRMAMESRRYLDGEGFMEMETPVLIKSTPEGARDFVVPSRLHPGQFYALPQSPQTFKQLLMIGGFDRYFQIVKCFRDEDLRADRQPEFTQIDCELAFVERDDILSVFERMTKHLFREIRGLELEDFPVLTYKEAMEKYGSDKPDLRFGMEFVELNNVAQGKGFKVFDSAELVVGVNAQGCANYSRKQLDALTEFVQQPSVGAKGLVYVKYNEDGTFKSSVDKFFGQDDLKEWAEKFQAEPGDLLLILAGEARQTREALDSLRLHMGDQLGLRNPDSFKPLWVVDFPMYERNEDTGELEPMHHPFTSPVDEDIQLLDSDPERARADAYDLVINGVELGSGSIRIHERSLQERTLSVLGLSKEDAERKFGFLLRSFEYGAPPHGGIAFGFDRFVALMAGRSDIRDFIAFPKNNAGRDVMIDAPSTIDERQLKELGVQVKVPQKDTMKDT